jgi:hypothetical protein
MATVSSSTTRAAAPEALSAALDFTHDDLQDNRAGLLSARQRRRLDHAFRRDILLIWGGLLLISAIILRPDVWLLTGRPPDDRTLVAITLITILWLVVMVATGVAFYRHRQDVGNGRVAQASGPIRRSTTRSGGRRNRKTVYRVSLAGETFTIPQAAYELLLDGESRTLFFTTYTNKVVSIL